MHDPMVVAFDIPAPWPRRSSWSDRDLTNRWGLNRVRRTNPEHLGQPVYPWWRPKGWRLALAGRCYRAPTLATVWHVEPGDRDAFEVCKHAGRWRWHVWHWKIQIRPLQELRARLFDRCEECGRKGRPNFSHQWHGKRLGWWKFRSRPGLYHMECSSLVHLRRQQTNDHDLIRHLAAALQLWTGETEAELLARLTDPKTRDLDSRLAYRLEKILGYRRDDDHQLVKAES